MGTHKLAPDTSILLDDTVFATICNTLVDSANRIKEINKVIKSNEEELNKTLFVIAFKLLEDNDGLKAFIEETDCEIVFYNHLERIFNTEKECSLEYDILDGLDSHVTLIFDDEAMEVISFPLNYAVRADWIAKLEIYSEAIKLKKENNISKEKALEEAKELRLLKSLMEKYKDKL